MSLDKWKNAPLNTLFLLDGPPDGVLAWEDDSALLAFQRKPHLTTVSIAARNLAALGELLEAAMQDPPFPPPWDLRIGQPDIKAIRSLAEPLGWEASQHYVALRRPDLSRLPPLRPIVRRATTEDTDALIALNEGLRAGEFRTLSAGDEVRTWLAEDQIFVAENTEGLTGFVVTWCYPREIRDHQFIAAVAVTERAREGDTGRALLIGALHWGRETGAKRALAWVEKNDLENRRLFESLGFEAYGDEELHLRWSGRIRASIPPERDPRPGDHRAGTVLDIDITAVPIVRQARPRRDEGRKRGRVRPERRAPGDEERRDRRGASTSRARRDERRPRTGRRREESESSQRQSGSRRPVREWDEKEKGRKPGRARKQSRRRESER